MIMAIINILELELERQRIAKYKEPKKVNGCDDDVKSLQQALSFIRVRLLCSTFDVHYVYPLHVFSKTENSGRNQRKIVHALSVHCRLHKKHEPSYGVCLFPNFREAALHYLF